MKANYTLLALFVIILVSPILNEIIDINDIKLQSNKVKIIHNYYWKVSQRENKSKINNQFTYNITIENIINSPQEGGVLHLFLISPQLFEYINILYEPGFCCVNTNIGLCSLANNQLSNSQKIINQSSYYTNLTIASNDPITIQNCLNTPIEGVYSTYIAFCSNNLNNNALTLKGIVSYSTLSGYLSFENNTLIYLYISIVSYLCTISLIWVSLVLKQNNGIQKAACFKLYSISIIIIISNKLLKVILMLLLNQKGRLIIPVVIINNCISVIGNILYRVIIYLVSLGYTVNPYLKLYKEEEKALSFLSQRKLIKFSTLMVIYSLVLFGFETTLVYYIYYHLNVIYPVMSLISMMITNFFFMFHAYNRINKKRYLATSIILKNLFSKYNAALTACFALNCLYVLFNILYILLSKYVFVFKLKWVVVLLFEGDQLVLFSLLGYLFIATPNPRMENKSIELEMGEAQDYSDSNNTKKDL